MMPIRETNEAAYVAWLMCPYQKKVNDREEPLPDFMFYLIFSDFWL